MRSVMRRSVSVHEVAGVAAASTAGRHAVVVIMCPSGVVSVSKDALYHVLLVMVGCAPCLLVLNITTHVRLCAQVRLVMPRRVCGLHVVRHMRSRLMVRGVLCRVVVYVVSRVSGLLRVGMMRVSPVGPFVGLQEPR